MKKHLPQILIVAILIGILVPTHFVHAGGLFELDVQGFLLSILRGIVLAILWLLSWILWFAGVLLNYVMDYTIVKMSANIAALPGINVSWKIIRDLMNVVFIFILVYEGILLIIDKGSLQSVKKFIFGVVMASLLINFSLFFTKVLIDASNIVTTGIYKSIIGPQPPSNKSKMYGLSDPVMESLGLSSIWGGPKEDPSLGDTTGKVLIKGFMNGVLILVASFVFFAISIMFIIRYIALLFLLMLSPIAYMGMALPAMESYAKQWWESLKAQLLFPPIYMIMTLVTLTLATNFSRGDYLSSLTAFDGVEPDANIMGLILNYAVIVGLLIASLIVSKETASKGSKYISNATKGLNSFAGGAVFGGAARLSRNTIGRAGNALANNEKVKDMSVNGNILTRNFAKAGIATGNKAATTNLDVRGSRVFQTIAKQAGMKDEFGKAPDSKKLNFREELKAKSESEKKRMEALKPSDEAYAEAKEKDKINDKIIEEEANKAKEKLKNNAHEKDAQEYFKSEEWKNTEIGRAETEAEQVVKNYEESRKASDDLDKKILENEKKIQQIREGKIFGDENIVREEQMLMQKEQEAKKQELSKLELLKTEKAGAIEAGKKARDTYVRDLKTKLEQTRDAEKGIYEKKQNQVWEERVNKEADSFGHQENTGGQLAWRDVTKVYGSVTHALGITSMPLTRADRQKIRRDMLKVPKGKKPKDELEEMIKKYTGTEEKKEEPKPETTEGGEKVEGENKPTA